jgi:hypothetical protein
MGSQMMGFAGPPHPFGGGNQQAFHHPSQAVPPFLPMQQQQQHPHHPLHPLQQTQALSLNMKGPPAAPPAGQWQWGGDAWSESSSSWFGGELLSSCNSEEVVDVCHVRMIEDTGYTVRMLGKRSDTCKYEGRRRYEFRFVLCTFASDAGCVDENDARKKERKKKPLFLRFIYFDDLIRYFVRIKI